MTEHTTQELRETTLLKERFYDILFKFRATVAPSSLPAGRQVAWTRIMSYYLYILENNAGKHYIGISANIHVRLIAHNTDKVRSTRAYKPWKIIHQEKYGDRIKARQREIELKTNYAKRNSILRHY